MTASRLSVQRDENAMQAAAPLPFAMAAPVHVARVGLKARDAETLAEYYRDVVGLREMTRRGASIVLGAGDRELMEIEQFSAARPDDPRSAGLYHTAFLLPARADLARWVRRAIDRQLPVAGASDHKVSEAVYLTDPEGNGIEIYVDRPHEGWVWENGMVKMATARMDIPGVVGSVPEGDAAWQGMPENTVVGHVHLRVGDPGAAESFWKEAYGFDTVARYGTQAAFMSSGGYHHHIAGNTWQSPGAGRRDPSRSGLSWVELRSSLASTSSEKQDPWGTLIRLVPDKV